MNKGHILYKKDDFKNWTAEQIEQNGAANAVMNWGLNVCKICQEYEAGLDKPCLQTDEDRKVHEISRAEFEDVYKAWPKDAPRVLLLVNNSDGTFIAVDNRDNEFIFEEFKDEANAREYLLEFDVWLKKHYAKIRGKMTGNITPPYNQSDYDAALTRGLDLDDWNDYQKYYRLGEQEEER